MQTTSYSLMTKGPTVLQETTRLISQKFTKRLRICGEKNFPMASVGKVQKAREADSKNSTLVVGS